jgi:hypothetical protein
MVSQEVPLEMLCLSPNLAAVVAQRRIFLNVSNSEDTRMVLFWVALFPPPTTHKKIAV